MTEADARQALKPSIRDQQYIEFYGNVQDVMLGCDNVPQAIELLQQLIAGYQE